GPNQGAVGSFSDVTSLVQANERIALLERSSTHREAFERLVGSTDIMQEVYRRIRLAADSDVTVFISGESGTGKELAAQAIHAQSDRRDKPFLAVNCSAIPETLLESELFGHVKGAFTGAVKDKRGMFQAADGGTLFLDEIGDVSPLLQLKLLRVLQEREIRRVGDEQSFHVDVRVVTATNRDLKELI
ncbi:MAG: sigma-54 factor interaction domain-containing protein, partial [Gammaproteobacteria bacterium]|nr:sigma-54 factor interaction domain-containing protein [Gammaproteobacteria bacterium]